MDLVPVMKHGAEGASRPESPPEHPEFRVPVERQQQIGVTWAEAAIRPLVRTIRAYGTVAEDKSRQWEFVARVEGYVEKLHVTSPGEEVEEGQPLLTIYSPELLTAERELVNLLEARDRTAGAEAKASAERSVDAARARLQQWNVTAKQVAGLEASRKPSEFLTLVSPARGTIRDVPVIQGRKVMIGEPLVAVADLSRVWIWAEFYEEELSILAKGQAVAIVAKAWPGQSFPGEIALISPFLDDATRTAKARIDISNPDWKLRPGMYVAVELTVNAGEGLTIPVSAVLPTGAGSLVFVDKGEGKLEPRAVRLGLKYGEDYEVLAGVKPGERVVASANFLIDAEAKVQGAVKSFEPPAPEAAK
jgi:Cu(I)/Ag(I) efflux system membrane fusion protein